MTLQTIADRCRAAGVPYLSRQHWGHTLPLGPAMTLPARESWVHHSVTIADDDGDLLATEDVVADMLEIERVGRARFGRFPYSWCIHPSGVIGEGAGFNIGAHTANHNSTSFGICAIGDYSTAAPPERMLRAYAVLLAVLEDEGAIVAGTHPTGGHRDTKATGCPGDALYNQLPAIRAMADDPALLNPAPSRMETDMLIVVWNPYNGRGYAFVQGKLIWITGPAGLPPADKRIDWTPDTATMDRLNATFGPYVE